MSSFKKATLTAFTMSLLVLLSGCSGLTNFTPERAVLEQMLSSQRGQADTDTVQIMQKVEIGDRVMVLAAYEMTRGNKSYECLDMYETFKSTLGPGWQVGSGSGGCKSIGEASFDNKPFSISGGSFPNEKFLFSEVNGLVYGSEITEIEVTWDDGETQNVEVIKGTYLAVRTGEHNYQKIQGFDSDGEVVYTWEPTQAAPVKE